MIKMCTKQTRQVTNFKQMKLAASKFIQFFKNPSVILLIAFVIWVALFDENSLVSQSKLKNKIDSMEKMRDFYIAENEVLDKEMDAFNNNLDYVEKIARENFYLKKQNEDIFLVDEN